MRPLLDAFSVTRTSYMKSIGSLPHCSVQTQNRSRCTWCTAPSTSAVLEIRSTVPARMSIDSSNLCRILLRLLSRHKPFSIWKHTQKQRHTDHGSPHVSSPTRCPLSSLYLQRLSASGQLQLDVLLSQVAGVLLRLQTLLQRVLVTAEGQGDLGEGGLGETAEISFIYETYVFRNATSGTSCPSFSFTGFASNYYMTPVSQS